MTLSRLLLQEMKEGLPRHNIIDLHSKSKVQFLRNKININGDIYIQNDLSLWSVSAPGNIDQSEIINIILLSSISSSMSRFIHLRCPRSGI